MKTLLSTAILMLAFMASIPAGYASEAVANAKSRTAPPVPNHPTHLRNVVWRNMQATRTTQASIASISIAQTTASPSNSEVCQQTFRPATTGGAIREQLEAMTKCRLSSPQSSSSEPSSEQSKNTSPIVDDTNINTPGSSVDNSSYPAYCPALPPGVKPGDFEYNEALYKCKYGS